MAGKTVEMAFAAFASMIDGAVAAAVGAIITAATAVANGVVAAALAVGRAAVWLFDSIRAFFGCGPSTSEMAPMTTMPGVSSNPPTTSDGDDDDGPMTD